MSVNELHNKEKALFDEYQDGLISDIDYFGSLFTLTKDFLEKRRDYLLDKSDEIDAYLDEGY